MSDAKKRKPLAITISEKTVSSLRLRTHVKAGIEIGTIPSPPGTTHPPKVSGND